MQTKEEIRKHPHQSEAAEKRAKGDTIQPPSPVNATYVEPSAEHILKPGTKVGDLFRRNMTQPYVLQRLSQRTWWAQAFNYGTIFHVGERGVLIFDTLEGVYENISQAIRSVTDKPVIAAAYPHYHADHIGDIAKYVDAAKSQGVEFQIIGSTKTRDSMNLANSSFPRPSRLLQWPRDSFEFDGLTVELHGFEWAAHSDDHSAWLLKLSYVSRMLVSADWPLFVVVTTSAAARLRFTVEAFLFGRVRRRCGELSGPFRPAADSPRRVRS